MKLALIGKSVSHSLSPKLYQEILGTKLESYELLDVESEYNLPSLSDLRLRYDAINITAPFKRFYIEQTSIDEASKKLGAINTVTWNETEAHATNTDLLAVTEILKDFKSKFSELQLIILGSGVMAQLTILVCQTLNLKFINYSRANGHPMSNFTLYEHFDTSLQTLVINACSRQFIFNGKLHSDFIFWDFNYNFIPHQNTLPSQVKLYLDGQVMLRLQAEAAVTFWLRTNPNLTTE